VGRALGADECHLDGPEYLLAVELLKPRVEHV
jgi:hypothetical protein